MPVYELRRQTGKYQWLTMVREEDFDVQFQFDGDPIGRGWTPRAVKVIEDDLSAGALPGDFPTLGNIPVFSQRAIDLLLDLLVENGEILPLESSGGRYFAYNVTKVVDALDEHRSELNRYRDGAVKEVLTFAFHPERLAGLSIFKVPQLLPDVFVTDRFVQRIQDAELAGFDFRRVWPAR